MKLVPLKDTKQSPLRVVLDILVVALKVVIKVELQRATGFPELQDGGATLCLKVLLVTQHEQGLARVLVSEQPHCYSGIFRSLRI